MVLARSFSRCIRASSKANVSRAALRCSSVAASLFEMFSSTCGGTKPPGRDMVLVWCDEAEVVVAVEV